MSPLDRLFLDRAYELAARGIGSTAPNPAVGAVVVRDGHIIGEGYHHRAGDLHAEPNALREAGDARGATAYVTLEPCNHHGRTPPCSLALIDAKVARVVVGALDPNPKTDGGGVDALRAAGIEVIVANEQRARGMIEPFAFAVRHTRPFLALKMAMSLDGKITSKPGVQEWITSEEERLYVRDLRIAYDAVMVGAGTIRVDDAQLTVRPPSHRLRPYTRIVMCETDTVPEASRVFSHVSDYAKTIVVAPAGARDRFNNLRNVAHVMFVGDETARHVDLPKALVALKEAGIQSILCEGGPTLGGRLVAQHLVDRFYWAIAPTMLTSAAAVPVLTGADLAGISMHFDGVEMVGPDVVVTGRFHV